MRSFFVATFLIFSIEALCTMSCGITGEYRCRGGNTGTVNGQGRSADHAKNNARDRARDLCGGRLDYVRFVEDSLKC